jgi:hypothetical protein
MPSYLKPEAQQALLFFDEWKCFTEEALKIVAPKCPMVPTCKKKDGSILIKTRPWENPQGPVGIIYHYTAGPDGIASMRWGNENLDNTGSSWHATVLDHRLAQLEHLLKKYPLVAANLHTTAFLHADIMRGTWHGNWTNAKTFGIENRNVGPLVERNNGLGQILTNAKGESYFRPLPDQRRAIKLHGRWWESYTREQILTNINIGKMLRAWRGCDLDPSWVLPHSAVWWGKSDVGPAFPMEAVRDAIYANVDASTLTWIGGLSAEVVSHTDEPDDIVRDPQRVTGDEPLYTPVSAKDFDAVAGEDWRDFLPALRDNLRLLGYYVPHVEAPFDPRTLEVELRQATHIFQNSTHSPAYKSGPALTVDGIPGSKTRSAIEERLRSFGHKV